MTVVVHSILSFSYKLVNLFITELPKQPEAENQPMEFSLYAFTSDEESLVSAYNKLDVPTQFGVLSVVKSLADNPKHRNREINRSLTTMSEAELEALDAKDEK